MRTCSFPGPSNIVISAKGEKCALCFRALEDPALVFWATLPDRVLEFYVHETCALSLGGLLQVMGAQMSAEGWAVLNAGQGPRDRATRAAPPSGADAPALQAREGGL